MFQAQKVIIGFYKLRGAENFIHPGPLKEGLARGTHLAYICMNV